MRTLFAAARGYVEAERPRRLVGLLLVTGGVAILVAMLGGAGR